MKNLLFKTFNCIMALTFILSVCSLNGERWIIPTVTMFVSMAYLGTVLMIHNYRVYVRGDE